MSAPAELNAEVRDRAQGRCEYCRSHQSLQGATFHLEHIAPTSKGGLTESENLAIACPTCNFKKSSQVDGIDPNSGQLVGLFHPRRQRWNGHFRWVGFEIEGLTPSGRATVQVLELNSPRRLLIREAEAKLGLAK